MKYLSIKLLIGGSICLIQVSPRYIIKYDPLISTEVPISIIERQSNLIHYFEESSSNKSSFSCINKPDKNNWSSLQESEGGVKVIYLSKDELFGPYVKIQKFEEQPEAQGSASVSIKIESKYFLPKNKLLKKYCYLKKNEIDWRIFSINSYSTQQEFPYLLESKIVFENESTFLEYKIIEYFEKRYTKKELNIISQILGRESN